MVDHLLELVRAAMLSPWIYLALVALTWLDGVAPAVPGESAVISAGAFAATGRPNAALVVLAATIGAAAGDHTAYALGRWLRRPATRWAGRRDRRAGVVRWATSGLERQGGLMIIVARFVPAGRTAVSLTAGATGYGLSRFSPFTMLAASSWAVYGTSLGYLGGLAFADRPFEGLAVGLAVALALTTLLRTGTLLRRAARQKTPDVDSRPP